MLAVGFLVLKLPLFFFFFLGSENYHISILDLYRRRRKEEFSSLE